MISDKQKEILQEESNFRVPNSINDWLSFNIVLKKGAGSRVEDIDGHSYIDLSGGITSSITGHCHEKYVKDMAHEISRMNNMNQFSVDGRLDAYQALSGVFPKEMSVFEFYNGGAEAVEQAIRIILANGGLRKRRIAAFEGSYHGKTEGALRIVQPLFGKEPSPSFLAPLLLTYPTCYDCPFQLEPTSCKLKCLDHNLELLDKERFVGGIIFEPMRFDDLALPPVDYWQELQKYCKSRKILLIADEISCGSWRTGKFLACEHYQLIPDVVLCSRGIGSGFPVVVLAGKKDVLSVKNYLGKGESYSSCNSTNLAMAAVRSTIEIVVEEKMADKVEKTAQMITKKFNSMTGELTAVQSFRGIGSMFGLFLDLDENMFSQFVKKLFAQGVLCQVNPQFKVLYFTPALNIDEQTWEEAIQIIYELCKEFSLVAPVSPC